MAKTVAIIQSGYIPWKGFFDILNRADDFVLYDDAQFTKRDWRSRNKIKTPNGPAWLTVPVEVKGKFDQKIKDTRIADKNWAKKHWHSIETNYAHAKFFKEYKPRFEELYLGMDEEFLSLVNFRFIQAIVEVLSISTKIHWSSDFDLPQGQTEKLVSICKNLQATKYLSGPAAKNYMDESLFNNEGMEVEWMDFANYPEYDQLFPPFDHKVTVLDLIFNTGKEAQKYLLSF